MDIISLTLLVVLVFGVLAGYWTANRSRRHNTNDFRVFVLSCQFIVTLWILILVVHEYLIIPAWNYGILSDTWLVVDISILSMSISVIYAIGFAVITSPIILQRDTHNPNSMPSDGHANVLWRSSIVQACICAFLASILVIGPFLAFCGVWWILGVAAVLYSDKNQSCHQILFVFLSQSFIVVILLSLFAFGRHIVDFLGEQEFKAVIAWCFGFGVIAAPFIVAKDIKSNNTLAMWSLSLALFAIVLLLVLVFQLRIFA